MTGQLKADIVINIKAAAAFSSISLPPLLWLAVYIMESRLRDRVTEGYIVHVRTFSKGSKLEFVNNVYRNVGMNVRERRQKLGLTLEQVGELSGLLPSYIGQIERNVKKPSLLTLERLAGALRLPIARLFGSAGGKAPSETERLEALLGSNTPRERKLLFAILKGLSKEIKSLR